MLKETQDTKQQIIKSFQQLLEERKKLLPKISTKEEVVERERDKQIVEVASTYTVESIIKELAELQLYVGGTADMLVDILAKNIRKLEEIGRAIEVETKHLEDLRHIKVAAEALNILKQEQYEKTISFEKEVKDKNEALDRDIFEKRQKWQMEQQEHEQSVVAYDESLKKERQQEEENYLYEMKRKRKLEKNAYEEKKKKLESELAEAAAKKEEDWSQREAILAANEQLFEEYKTRVQTLPQELEEEIKQAREEAMKAAQKAAEVKAELFEKEIGANRKVYELRIQSLSREIENQNEQIKELSADLKSAQEQARKLSEKAIEGYSRVGKTMPKFQIREDTK